MNVATSIEDETGKDPSRAEIIAEILKNIDILTKIFQILPFWKITENAHLL